MQLSSLTDLIAALIDETKLSFSVEQNSEIFSSKITHLPTRFYLHSTKFCTAAKNTMKGHQSCLDCKRLCRSKILNDKKPFFGTCVYGITEYVYPIYIDDKLKCSLFIGNMMMDRQATEERIRRRCRKTGVSPEKLIALLDQCEANADLEKVKKIARIIESYLILLNDKIDSKNPDNMHWAVHETVQTIHVYYSDPLTLKDCADRFFINEKYLGRIFKEQIGQSFHEYLSEVRLRKARNLLVDTSLSITAISYECGFSNISYFNRSFKKKYGYSPGGYRKIKARF